MSEQPASDATVDPRDNPESAVAEGEASHTLGRASDGGQQPSGGRPEGSVPGDPETDSSGTAQGDQLGGLVIDPDDAEDAVPGDDGPEHPGRR